ncbi:undecaprenyl-diphosphate phosphatase [Deinococcus maricopensis]|uniref:Undecaprenyl-diphosphatase n=1 Tax=Deinococcus maricopensis (strain DSM 21211 / LMG 22137 / NRRL B-23946 / LB-34) TaxID=709986 RepID=E8U924_DEIML|nr:undecaprenyl-diphosphate phosphatase [Deinococcus maricopensis]ADV67563.1 Undecaprenyl-diphosphatase [Deinococcus maricopensis DSM 21211]
MENWLIAIIQGIVEGVTEFLPISSTGHLIVTGDLLKPDWSKAAGDTFEVVIQGGAILAVLVYYARDLLGQARVIGHDQPTQRLWAGVVAACLPALMLGVLFSSKIKEVLFRPTVVAWALIVGGILMYLIELRPRQARVRELKEIGVGKAFLIGAAQCLALLWPGFSRSASSILGGMLMGLDRPTATKFSFYLGIPTLGGAALVDFIRNRDVLGEIGMGSVAIGFITSFVVAYFAIGWLLQYVSKHDFKGFAIYRIIAGAVILALIATGVIHDTIRV